MSWCKHSRPSHINPPPTSEVWTRSSTNTNQQLLQCNSSIPRPLSPLSVTVALVSRLLRRRRTAEQQISGLLFSTQASRTNREEKPHRSEVWESTFCTAPVTLNSLFQIKTRSRGSRREKVHLGKHKSRNRLKYEIN